MFLSARPNPAAPDLGVRRKMATVPKIENSHSASVGTSPRTVGFGIPYIENRIKVPSFTKNDFGKLMIKCSKLLQRDMLDR